jgi:hypothetical protein
VAFIDGEGRTPDWSFRVALVPVKFHDHVPAGEDITGEKLADVAVERTDFPGVQSYGMTVGPINGPQARVPIVRQKEWRKCS